MINFLIACGDKNMLVIGVTKDDIKRLSEGVGASGDITKDLGLTVITGDSESDIVQKLKEAGIVPAYYPDSPQQYDNIVGQIPEAPESEEEK